MDVVLDLLSVPASTGLKTKIIAWEHFNYHYIWPSKMYQKFRHAAQWFSARKDDLGTLMQEHAAGDTLSITIARDGQMQTVNVTLGEKTASNS